MPKGQLIVQLKQLDRDWDETEDDNRILFSGFLCCQCVLDLTQTQECAKEAGDPDSICRG